MKAIFLRTLEETEDKNRGLREAIEGPYQAVGRTRFELDPAVFGQIPRSPFAYWVSDRIRAIFTKLPPFESEGRVAKVGLQTSDDFRFVRLWTEIRAAPAAKKRWFPFAKGGEFSPFYSDIHLMVDWGRSGLALKAYSETTPGTSHWSRKICNTDYYLRPGLTWPIKNRGDFKPRALPPGCLFAHVGSCGFVEDDSDDELSRLLGCMSSSAFTALLCTMAGWNFEAGVVKAGPLPVRSSGERVGNHASRAWSLQRLLDTHREGSHAFHLPALVQVGAGLLSHRVALWKQRVADTEAELARLQAKIDSECFDLYDVTGADREQIERGLGGSAAKEDTKGAEGAAVKISRAEGFDAGPLVVSLLSWCVGVALGRFDIRLATGERSVPPEPELFAPLPACSPGMLTGEDGLSLDSPPAGYPIDFPHDGILVDDAGSPRDLVAAVRQVFEYVFAEPAARWEEAAEILGERDRTLRSWFARDFFGLHLKQYSRSRRKAPIYWPLSTASGSYTVWLYCHRLTADTLFHVVVEYLDPKIREVQEDRVQADARAGGSEGREAAKLAKQAGELAELEQELEEMKAELLRVAELPYKPNLNDGVQITAAPLWKLFRQKAWSKVLEATRKKLEKGGHDWAHLALSIWPERVREKCNADRALAIAHELEDLCDAEGAA